MIMKAGDLIMFTWPEGWSNVDDPLSWERARLGVIVDIIASRPEDEIGHEFLVIHDGERWSVPEAWCRPIRDSV